MRVIPPVTLNYSNVTSTAGSGNDPATTWSGGATYNLGDKVKVVGTVNRIYQYLGSNGTNSTTSPEIDITKLVPKWVDLGSTNVYGMFDTSRDTTTIADYTLVVVMTPGVSVDSIALLNMKGITNIRIQNTGTGTAYDKSFNVNDRFTASWYQYFFGFFRTKKAMATFDLPSNGTIFTVTFIGGVGMTIGACVLGTAINIGSIQKGATINVDNFSSINRDVFGNAQLVARRNVPKTSQTLYVDKSKLDTLIALKYQLDATPAVWCGFDDDYLNNYFNALLILGFYRSFTFNLSNPAGPSISLELEEL